MLTFQFESLMEGATKCPIHTDFMSAWNDMYEYVKARLADGNLSPQELDTAIWIERIEGKTKSPIYFHAARDMAITAFGWKHKA